MFCIALCSIIRIPFERNGSEKTTGAPAALSPSPPPPSIPREIIHISRQRRHGQRPQQCEKSHWNKAFWLPLVLKHQNELQQTSRIDFSPSVKQPCKATKGVQNLLEVCYLLRSMFPLNITSLIQTTFARRPRYQTQAHDDPRTSRRTAGNLQQARRRSIIGNRLRDDG